MDINLELYKVFYYVATTLSFSEASRELFISQSAVSQSIKTLEKKLNHTLFIRSTKKVLLTPEGELLLQHVKPAIQMLDEGESLLSGDNMLKGQLRIGASDTICRYYLIHYLQKFHQEFPDVRIKVTNSTSIGCAESARWRRSALPSWCTTTPQRRCRSSTASSSPARRSVRWACRWVSLGS